MKRGNKRNKRIWLRPWLVVGGGAFLLWTWLINDSIVAQKRETGQDKPELVVQTGHSSEVNSVWLSPDETRLISLSDDRLICWDVKTQRALGEIKDVNDFYLMPGSEIAIMTKGQSLSIREVKTCQELFSVDDYSDWEVTADGTKLAVSTSPPTELYSDKEKNATIKIYELPGSQITKIVLPEKEWVKDLVFNSDGSRLFYSTDKNSKDSFSGLGTVYAADTRSGRTGQIETDVSNWAIDESGKKILLGFEDAKKIDVYSIDKDFSSRKDYSLEAITKDWETKARGKYLLAQKSEQQIGIWEIATGRQKLSVPAQDAALYSFTFSNDGKIVHFIAAKETKIYDLEKEKFLLSIPTDDWETKVVENNVFFKTQGFVKVQNINDGKEIFSGEIPGKFDIFPSSDGKKMAIKAYEKEQTVVKTFDLATREENSNASFKGRTINVNQLVETRLYLKAPEMGFKFKGAPTKDNFKAEEDILFSKNDKKLIFGETLGDIRLLNLESQAGKHLVFRGFSSAVNAAYSKDQKSLDIYEEDGTFKKWDIATGDFVFNPKKEEENEKFTLEQNSGNCVLKNNISQKAITFENCESSLLSEKEKFLAIRKEVTINENSRKVSFEIRDAATQALIFSQANAPQEYDTSFTDFGFIGEKYIVISREFVPTTQNPEKQMVEVWDILLKKKLFSVNVGFKNNWEINPDGKHLAIIRGGDSKSYGNLPFEVREIPTGKVLFERKEDDENEAIEKVAFNDDGRKMFLRAGKELSVLNTDTFKVERHCSYCGDLDQVFGYNETYEIEFSPSNEMLVAYSNKNKIFLWNTKSPRGRFGEILENARVRADGEELPEREDRDPFLLDDHSDLISNFSFSPNEHFLMTSSKDGTIKYWDTGTGEMLFTLFLLGEEDWVIVDNEGRFDTSPGAARLIDLRLGDNLISLEQLKDSYYEPNLWKKLLGINNEKLSKVPDYKDLLLPPEVEEVIPGASDPDSTVHTVKLKNKGGGIGRVQVFVNGREFIRDARDEGLKQAPDSSEYLLDFDLKGAPVIKGQKPEVRIVAWNYDKGASGKGNISSRGTELIRLATPKEGTIEPPTLYAIIGGVSDYAGNLDLKFAAKDAEDIYQAIRTGGKNLFGVEKMKLKLLSTGGKDGSLPPTKDNFRQAFEEFAKEAKPNDILFVYLSGHGITLGHDTSNRNIYYYLAKDATTTNKEVLGSDSNLLKRTTISSEELKEWHKKIPALKQVLILDTCAAGAVSDEFKIIERKDLPADAKRALEDMHDVVGFHILMGSASDSVSYEASQYGQGLLTYSLLQGMRGAALDSGGQIDISKLFNYSRRLVPDLAKNIGGIQRPEIRVPDGGTSFSIGLIKDDNDKRNIPLALVKPLILRPNLQNRGLGFDNLKLNQLIKEVLRADNKSVVFVDSDEMPEAITPAGNYAVENGKVSVTVNLVKNDTVWRTFTVTGESSNLPNLVQEIFKQITVMATAK